VSYKKKVLQIIILSTRFCMMRQ